MLFFSRFFVKKVAKGNKENKIQVKKNKMNYRETLDFLYNSLPVFHHIGGTAYKPGLDNIAAFMDRLGNPQRNFRSVHVAGTNGKGSVSHMTAAVLSAAGYKTGLFTSPHLKDFRERIRVDGNMIPEERVVEFVENHREVIREVQPSFFEIATAIALEHFAREQVDIAVIEVGMGGRLDSTNIIRPLVSVITNIGMDHTQFLGDTFEKIAGEKAGIIKPETPVVVGESLIDTQMVFISRARECRSPLLFADQCYRVVETVAEKEGQRFRIENRMDGNTFELSYDLAGSYQRKNVPTVLTTLDVLNGSGGLAISPEAVRKGLVTAAASTGLSGRWQVIGHRPLMVCDTGHNAHGLTEVVAQIRRQSFQKLFMVVGFVADKNLNSVLPLLPPEAYYIFTRAGIERALGEEQLATQAAQFGLQGKTAPTVPEAVRRARELAGPEDMIFIGGSTFVVAEAL